MRKFLHSDKSLAVVVRKYNLVNYATIPHDRDDKN